MLKKYTNSEHKISFFYPAKWKLYEEKIPGGEIIFHLNISEPGNKLRGFIQIWLTEINLQKFIENAKWSATGNIDYSFYKEKERKISGLNGLVIEYGRKDTKGNFLRGYEAFFKDGQRLYRISFFISDEKWSKRNNIMLSRVLTSFQIKK